MKSLLAINGLIAVGRVGNLLCGRPSFIVDIEKLNPQTQDLTTVHEEQLETKFSKETEKCLPPLSLSIMMLTALVLPTPPFL